MSITKGPDLVTLWCTRIEEGFLMFLTRQQREVYTRYGNRWTLELPREELDVDLQTGIVTRL